MQTKASKQTNKNNTVLKFSELKKYSEITKITSLYFIIYN